LSLGEGVPGRIEAGTIRKMGRENWRKRFALREQGGESVRNALHYRDFVQKRMNSGGKRKLPTGECRDGARVKKGGGVLKKRRRDDFEMHGREARTQN